MDTPQLCRRERLGGHGKEVAFSAQVQYRFGELFSRMGDNPVESSWVRIRQEATKSDVLGKVCHRRPDQDDIAGKTCKELEISVSQTLVHMRSFGLSDICWDCNITGHKEITKEDIRGLLLHPRCTGAG